MPNWWNILTQKVLKDVFHYLSSNNPATDNAIQYNCSNGIIHHSSLFLTETKVKWKPEGCEVFPHLAKLILNCFKLLSGVFIWTRVLLFSWKNNYISKYLRCFFFKSSLWWVNMVVTPSNARIFYCWVSISLGFCILSIILEMTYRVLTSLVVMGFLGVN